MINVTHPYRSKSVWKNTCHPIFTAAGLKLEVVETQRTQHAFGIAKSVTLKDTAALACVGGDGTMSEILQVSTFCLALTFLFKLVLPHELHLNPERLKVHPEER